MAKCRYCGRDIAPNSQFCPYCNCVNPIKNDDASWSGDTKKEEPKQETNSAQQTSQSSNQDQSSGYFAQQRREQPIQHQLKPSVKAKKCDRPKVNGDPHTRDVPLDKIDGMAIAGFVCSFFVPFIGLPFSITAYYRCKTDYYLTNTRYAKAGIIISIIMLVAWFITLIVVLAI